VLYVQGTNFDSNLFRKVTAIHLQIYILFILKACTTIRILSGKLKGPCLRSEFLKQFEVESPRFHQIFGKTFTPHLFSMYYQNVLSKDW